ncbi:MAG: hypothetical protein U1F49_00580 [Rubrivivax sp.]
MFDAWSALQRTPALPERDARLGEVQRHVRSRLAEGGTTLRFHGERRRPVVVADGKRRRQRRRSCCSRPSPRRHGRKTPRIVNGALARQKGGAWRTTTANLWACSALQRFGKAFESEAVGGRSVVELGNTARTVDWAGAGIHRRSSGGSGAGTGAPPALLLPAGTARAARRAARRHRPAVAQRCSRSPPPLKQPLFAGYRIAHRLRSSAGARRFQPRRHRARALEIEALADMAWVVVSDLLFAGASHLGTGLARDSAIATQGERREGWREGLTRSARTTPGAPTTPGCRAGVTPSKVQ